MHPVELPGPWYVPVLPHSLCVPVPKAAGDQGMAQTYLAAGPVLGAHLTEIIVLDKVQLKNWTVSTLCSACMLMLSHRRPKPAQHSRLTRLSMKCTASAFQHNLLYAASETAYGCNVKAIPSVQT